MSGEPVPTQELRAIGAPQWLIDIAATHGYDVGLYVWKRLSEESGEDRRIFVPRWSTYLRRQRNMLIYALGDQGFRPRAIQAKLEELLGVRLSTQQIWLLLRDRKHD